MVVPMQPIIEELGSLRRSIDSLEAGKKDGGSEDVYVQNLDEVKSHLRNELERFGKNLKSIIESSKLPTFNISETIKLSNIADLEKALERFSSATKSLDFTELESHLSALESSSKLLSSAVKSLDGAISKSDFKPNINVTVPEIKVPNIYVPKPEVTVKPSDVNIDMSAVVDALEPLSLLSRNPKLPISVRLSDGKKFIEELSSAIERGNDQLATVVSTSYGLTKAEYKAAETELRTGMPVPYHNSEVVDESVAGTTTITYKLNGTTVGTKTIVVVGAVTTITVA